MASTDRENFSKLDQLSADVEGDVATSDVADDSRNRDATRAQDMVEQICEKITQKSASPVKVQLKQHIPWKVRTYIDRVPHFYL